MFGVEIMDLNKTEIMSLKNLESNVLKSMLGLKKRCYSRQIFNAVKIGQTERHINKMKLKFYLRVRENEFTNKVLCEFETININNKFTKAIHDQINTIAGTHHNGEEIIIQNE